MLPAIEWWVRGIGGPWFVVVGYVRRKVLEWVDTMHSAKIEEIQCECEVTSTHTQ